MKYIEGTYRGRFICINPDCVDYEGADESDNARHLTRKNSMNGLFSEVLGNHREEDLGSEG